MLDKLLWYVLLCCGLHAAAIPCPVGNGSTHISTTTPCTWQYTPQDNAIVVVRLVVTKFRVTDPFATSVYIRQNNVTTQSIQVGVEPIIVYVPNKPTEVVVLSNTPFKLEMQADETLNCWRDCSAKGWCRIGECTCVDIRHIGDDCSVVASTLGIDMVQHVESLPPDEWVYFSFELQQQQTVVVELEDLGHQKGSRPLLALGHVPPTQDQRTVLSADFETWYYQNGNLHTVAPSLVAGTYYVGVHNRYAKGAFTGKVSLRMGTLANPFPCPWACSGNGRCNFEDGTCDCHRGWVGDTCDTAVEDVEVNGNVRWFQGVLLRGDWAMYRLDNPREGRARSIQVEMHSTSPRAHGILAARRDRWPALMPHHFPDPSAVLSHFTDPDGYYLHNGEFQRLNFTLGKGETIYVGVYNIWGFSTYGSQDVLPFDLYIGPEACPFGANRQTCSGFPCAGNVCQCPNGFFGVGCERGSTLVEEAELAPAFIGSVVAGDAAYFYLPPSENNYSVRVHLTHPESEDSAPLLLARQGAEPFYASHDDNDFTSHFLGENKHSLTLDNLERQTGPWVVGVHNQGFANEKLHYIVHFEFSDYLSCPNNCSDHGDCDTFLGRCNCHDGYALDDCSALFQSDEEIPVGHWAFWKVLLGCSDLVLDVELRTVSGAPALFIARNHLPLMSLGPADFKDFYGGFNYHRHQRIVVEKCHGVNCGVFPLDGGGTVWKEKSPEPGIYYVGVYNDPFIAHEPIANHSLSSHVFGMCADDCDPYLVGTNCDVECPGVNVGHFSQNVPVRGFRPCSGRGNCQLENGGAVCQCVEGYVGAGCEIDASTSVRPTTVAPTAPATNATNDTNDTNATNATNATITPGFSDDVIVGIVVGIMCLVGFVWGLYFFCIRRRVSTARLNDIPVPDGGDPAEMEILHRVQENRPIE